MKNVVVTGATGSIGVALVEALVAMNVNVTVICREGSNRIKNVPESPFVKIVECNLDKLETLSNVLSEHYDVFFHFAWVGTTGESRNDIRAQISNVQYTIDAVNLAKKLGCKRFIGAGSQAEYGRYTGVLNETIPVNPENGYGIAKLCAGQMSRIRCAQLGMEHIWVRVLSVYGPCDSENTMIQSVIKALLRGEVPHCTKGEQIWDYLYSKDAASAFVKLAQTGVDGKVYCLGSGNGRPLADYIKVIRDKINPELELGMGDIPYSAQQVMYLCADISQLTEDVGFLPQTEFEDGILETIEWVKKLSY